MNNRQKTPCIKIQVPCSKIQGILFQSTSTLYQTPRIKDIQNRDTYNGYIELITI